MDFEYQIHITGGGMMDWNNIDWVHPWFLALLPIVIGAAIWWRLYTHKKVARVTFPGIPDTMPFSIRAFFSEWLPLLTFLSMMCFVIALARPQKMLQEKEIKADGIDIFMILDLSSSMLARDFKPDRLEASKKIGAIFIDKRPHDRIGLAVFAGEAFTQCPLTTDHKVLKEFMAGLSCGFLEDGTAMGMGLAAGVNRLKESLAESKVIILLTDGVNNAGYIQPMTAAEIAKEFEVKVYTIGVGSEGTALSPVSKRRNGDYIFGMARVEIDEVLLREISRMTGGQYFRARDEASLQQIYDRIDALEKTEMNVTVIKRYEEEFLPFVLLGLFLLGLYQILRWTLLKIYP